MAAWEQTVGGTPSEILRGTPGLSEELREATCLERVCEGKGQICWASEATLRISCLL